MLLAHRSPARRRRRPRRIGRPAVVQLALALGLVAMHTVANAQEPQALVLAHDGTLSCQRMQSCGEGEPMCQTGVACGTVGEGSEAEYCHFADDTFLCCDSSGEGSGDADCTLYNDRGRRFDGVCLSVEGLLGGPGVCQYSDPGADTFCDTDPATAETWIVPCMTAPGEGGLPVANWLNGDCDRDGTRNGREWARGCDSCNAEDYPLEGGGCSITIVPDGGVDPNLDGGPGDGTTPRTSFRGSGGCTCRAAGGGPLDVGALPLLAALAVLWLGFRSSRRAGRGL